MSLNQRRFVVYLAIGGSSYLIEMGSLFLLKAVFGLSDLLAVAVSFWIGLAAAFVLQKFVTFKNHDKKVGNIAKQLTAYGLLATWNYVFTLVAVAIFSQVVSVFVIRSITIAIITIWNYLLYQHFVFKIEPVAGSRVKHENK